MRNLVWILFALVLFDCKQTNRRKSFESSNAPQFSAQALLNQAPVFNLVDGDFAPQKLSSLESLTIPENLFTKEGDLLVMERSIPDLEWFVNKAQSPSSSSRPTVQGAVMFHECRLDSAACKATALNTWLYFDYSWGYASTSQGGAIYGSRAVIVPKVRSNLGSSQVFARICVRREFIESSLKSSCSNSDSSRFCCGAARAWTFNFSNSSMTEAEKQAASKQYALDRELDSLATKVSSLSSWAVESFPIPSDLAEREKKQGYKLIFDIASYEPPTLAALLRYGLPVQGNSSEIQASFKLTDEPPAPSSESSDWYMSVISTDPTRGATLVVKSSQTKQGQVAGLDQENPFPQLIEQISAGETAPNNPGTGTTVGTPGTGTTVGTPETSTTGGTPGTGTTVGTPETSTNGGTPGTGTTVGTPE
ncbi:MAG: hypothetical protein KA436_10490, partial [Oligoflexales bacterium]|nr:hypothetical protein [Oligoflexales bacterium]